MKPEENHIHIQFSMEDLKKDWLAERLSHGIRLPNRLIPRSFFLHDRSNVCAGYMVSYDGIISDEDIFFYCVHGQWRKLSERSADMFVIFIDGSSRKINILTGQMGKFPCFYSVSERKLVVSTSFALVNKQLARRELSPGELAEYLIGYPVSNVCDQTIVREVKQLPPATLMTADEMLNLLISPIFTLEEVSERKPPFLSIQEFTDNLLDTAKKVTQDHIDALGGYLFGSELSSGFDSSLVSYLARVSSKKELYCFTDSSPDVASGDSDLRVIADFCQKHGLRDVPVDISGLYPFASTKKNLKKGNYVTDYGFDRFWAVNKLMANEYGISAVFTGHGGDELYGSYSTDWIKYPIQMSYFSEIYNLLNSGSDRVITSKSKEILLDKNRFADKNFYPNIVSSSALAFGQLYFPFFWETGVWLLMPLADPRLIKLAGRMPISLRKKNKRQEIWKLRPDIFVPQQFVPKKSRTQWWSRFLSERREFVIDTLSRSVLGERELVRSKEIVKLLKNGQIEELTYGGVPLVIHSLLQLELFLQANGITS